MRKPTYKFTEVQMPDLSLSDRLLLHLYDRDLRAGRTGKCQSKREQDCEAWFQFSTTLLHSRDLAFLGIIRWGELCDLSDSTVPKDLRITLPEGHIGIAKVDVGIKRKFGNVLRRLIKNQLLRGFTDLVRAMGGGFGGKLTPHLCLWQDNRSVSEIVAVSLTTKGFCEAKTLAAKYNILMPWQIHPALVQDESLASVLLGCK
jgi:hypothetical protein